MRTARARAPCETEPTRLHLEEECRVRSIDRKMSSCSERSAKKTARQAYSGTLGHSMQTAPMILAVLVGTLTVLVAAGAISTVSVPTRTARIIGAVCMECPSVPEYA